MQRRAAPALAIVAMFVVITIAASSAAAQPIPVLTSNARERLPSATDGYLVWAQNSAAHPRHYNTYAKPTGDPKFRVNEGSTIGWGGGIDGTMLIHQQVSTTKFQSNLQLFDLASKARSSAPPGINTDVWEWHPSMSGDWVLFGRNNLGYAKHEWERVLLYNTSTDEKRLLDEVEGRGYNAPNQVAGDYATWERCSPGDKKCNAFVHTISTDTTTVIPPNLQQYAASVVPDGTVYFVRTGQSRAWKCGASSRIVRYPVGGPATVIAELPAGRDSFNTYAVENPDTSVTVFFDRVNCSNGQWDIFRIDGADTASPAIQRVATGDAQSGQVSARHVDAASHVSGGSYTAMTWGQR